MLKTINFKMSLEQLLAAINDLNMSYQQLEELFDVNGKSYEALEEDYRLHCLSMPEKRLSEERHTVYLEMQKAIAAISPVYEHPLVGEWLYKGDKEMPPEVLAIYEEHSADCMVMPVLTSKMSILCKTCPNEVFYKYYPRVIRPH